LRIGGQSGFRLALVSAWPLTEARVLLFPACWERFLLGDDAGQVRSRAKLSRGASRKRFLLRNASGQDIWKVEPGKCLPVSKFRPLSIGRFSFLQKGASTMSRSTVARSGVALAVEQLEDRSLTSVFVAPPVLNLHNTHGVLTEFLISDTTAGKTLAQEFSKLTITITSGGVTHTFPSHPLRVQSVDVNGDGVPDVMAKFSRQILKGLPAGTATVTVTDGTVSESTTVFLFNPGKHHGKH
jgi:hypothetical protein